MLLNSVVELVGDGDGGLRFHIAAHHPKNGCVAVFIFGEHRITSFNEQHLMLVHFQSI